MEQEAKKSIQETRAYQEFVDNDFSMQVGMMVGRFIMAENV